MSTLSAYSVDWKLNVNYLAIAFQLLSSRSCSIKYLINNWHNYSLNPEGDESFDIPLSADGAKNLAYNSSFQNGPSF